MGYFALTTNEFDNEDLNNISNAFNNFKLCKKDMLYAYLVDMSLDFINKINLKNYNKKDNGIIPDNIYYDYSVFDIIMKLFKEMLDTQLIYSNYILYIKLVLIQIKIKTVELDILTNMLSKYIHMCHNNTCFNDSIDEYTNEYKFKTNLHFKELSEYFFNNIHPLTEVEIKYYDKEKILFNINERLITDRNQDYYIRKLNEYKIPTEELDIMAYNRIEIPYIKIEKTIEETLESLFETVRKKDSKVSIKCVFNKIYYIIEDQQHFAD